MLPDQLRRFLEDHAWLESRRIMDLLRRIETTALELRDAPPAVPVIEMDGTEPEIVLPLERPLYTPAGPTPINSSGPIKCAAIAGLLNHLS